MTITPEQLRELTPTQLESIKWKMRKMGECPKPLRQMYRNDLIEDVLAALPALIAAAEQNEKYEKAIADVRLLAHRSRRKPDRMPVEELCGHIERICAESGHKVSILREAV